MSKLLYEEIILKQKQYPFIFHTDNPDKSNIAPNWHDALELLYCVSGCGRVICDGEVFDFNCGDVLVIEPNMIHAIYKVKPEFIYHCLIVDNQFLKNNGLSIKNVHFKRIISNLKVVNEYKNFVDIFYSSSKYKEAKIRQAILKLLISLYEKYSVFKEETTCFEKEKRIERINEVLSYIKSNYAKKLSLGSIADNFKISKFHLSREFKLFTGKTIFEAINLIRCKEARIRIMDGSTVSEAALSCGFDDVSNFTKVYKRVMGELPSDAKY